MLMQSDQTTTNLNPSEFAASIKQFSIQEKFFKWESYVKILKQSQSQLYESALQKFIENFPFNHTYWVALIENILKKPKSKALAVKTYHNALAKNSRCITLWRHYLEWLKSNILKSDPKYLKNQLEKASRIVGTHYEADFIFQDYFLLEEDFLKKFHMIKRALVSPLKQIDRIYDLIANYLDETAIPENILEQITVEEDLSLNSSHKKGTQEWSDEIKTKIKAFCRKLYEPTKTHVEQRYYYEQKLSFDEYRPFEGPVQIWKAYLNFIKNSGNVEFVYPLYQRALITLCDKESLWEDYFLILENEGDHNRALYLLRSHATFFENLSNQITYYWLEIEERQNPSRARELYIEFEKTQRTLEAFMRHIQLELRAKQYNNAKVLYETILTVFTSNMNIIAFVLIDYAEFTVKYFRDVEFAKKLLKTYFDSSIHNEYLFLNYLEFYINHLEFKDQDKSSKENFDTFLQILYTGLKRTLQNTPERFELVHKAASKNLRSYVDSIYLIKSAEKKIRQIENEFKKQTKDPLKRTYQEMVAE